MPQKPSSPSKEENFLVSELAAERGEHVPFLPGNTSLLSPALAEPPVFHEDNPGVSLEGGVAVGGAFAGHLPPPSLFLSDGTRTTANDSFTRHHADSDVSAAAQPAEGDTPAGEERLDDLFKGVSRMGSLGTLYWGQPRSTTPESMPDAASSEDGKASGLLPPGSASVTGNVFSGAPGGRAATPGVEAGLPFSEGGEPSVPRFFVNGEWHVADGGAVRWEGEGGIRHSFRMNERGEYSLEVEGPAAASALHLDIVYVTEGEGGARAYATLSFGAPGCRSDDAVVTHSTSAADEAGGTIYGGDALFSGAPADPPGRESSDDPSVRHGDGPAESITVSGFSFLGDSRLHLADILEDRDGLGLLLDSGRSTFSEQKDALGLDIATASGGEPHVDVTFQSGELESFSAGHMEQNGSAEGLEQALLRMMLSGSS